MFPQKDLEGSPAAQSDLLDLLPVGSALFGFVAAPVLLDLAGVPDPAWWQTVSVWADADSFDAAMAAAGMTGGTFPGCVAAAPAVAVAACPI